MTEAEYKAAVATLEVAQRKLGATPRTDPEARTVAAREVDQAMAAVREAKEALKLENTRRNFAGIGSPLHIACVERFPGMIAELEQRALEIQVERERVASERRAAKAAAAPPPAPAPPPASKRGEVEVIVRRAAREQ